MVIAPTPPTKPTAPTPPTMPAATSDLPVAAHSSSPVNSLPGNQVNPQVSNVVKNIEGLGKAFQGTSTQSLASEKSSPVSTPVTQTVATPQAPPLTSFDTHAETSSKTTVPDKNQVPDNKPSSSGYVLFLAVVVVVAIVLIGYRLLKNAQKQARTVIDYSERATTANNKTGIDVTISPQTTSPKAKSTFELRI